MNTWQVRQINAGLCQLATLLQGYGAYIVHQRKRCPFLQAGRAHVPPLWMEQFHPVLEERVGHKALGLPVVSKKEV